MNYSIAIAVSLLVFLPWMVILVINKSAASGATSWANLESQRLSLVKNWVGNIGRVFF
ncbi:hypothetical protein Q5688_33500 [Microcoleus sp. herbarium5]